MKHLFKNFLYLVLVAFACVFSACSSSDDDGPDITSEAKLLSFGFYEVDNEGVIFQDYAGTITGSSVSIAMPKDVDKTSLVAYFTTSEGASVSVSGVKQVSSSTVNNFSAPLDYIVSNGNLNQKYTVTVTKQADYVWSRLAVSQEVVGEFTFKMNPVTDIPYVLYAKNSDTEEERKAALLKYEGGAWISVGGDISEGRVSDLTLTFDASGRPYVAYTDYTNTIAQSATVKYFNGSSWVTIGQNFNDVRVVYNSLIFDADNRLTIFSMNNVAGGAIPRRGLNISTYNGASWTSNQTIPVRTLTNTYNPIPKVYNGALYLALYDFANDSGTFSVYKYQSGTWTSLGEGLRSELATALNYYDLDMAIDSKGNIHVIAIETIEGATKIVVHKYIAASQTWTILATPIDLATNKRYFSIAISPLDVPYVIYRNDEDKPAFVYIDNDTKTWTAPYVFNSVLPANESADIDFSSSGIGYTVYPDPDKKLVIEKYDVPQAQ